VTTRTLSIDRGDTGRRLDLVLRRHLTDVRHATRTRIQTWIEDGRVAINGARVHRAAARAAFGDTLTIVLPAETRRRTVVAEPLALTVLYEDDDLVAIDKPAGTVSHPTFTHPTGTVLNALLWQARGWPRGQRPSLVGRLDRGTSGVVLAAKTASAHAALQRTLASRDAEKTYLAIVYGYVGASRGRIDLKLGFDRDDRRRVVASASGAASRTEFNRVARVKAPAAGLSLLSCRLGTGRRHQIRAHLAARGWPIVGDPVYGEARWMAIDDERVATALRIFPRQALHAWRVTFTHPRTGARIRIEAPVPDDLRHLLSATGLCDPSTL